LRRKTAFCKVSVRKIRSCHDQLFLSLLALLLRQFLGEEAFDVLIGHAADLREQLLRIQTDGGWLKWAVRRPMRDWLRRVWPASVPGRNRRVVVDSRWNKCRPSSVPARQQSPPRPANPLPSSETRRELTSPPSCNRAVIRCISQDSIPRQHQARIATAEHLQDRFLFACRRCPRCKNLQLAAQILFAARARRVLPLEVFGRRRL